MKAIRITSCFLDKGVRASALTLLLGSAAHAWGQASSPAVAAKKPMVGASSKRAQAPEADRRSTTPVAQPESEVPSASVPVEAAGEERWEIRLDDKTIYRTLSRWSRKANWQLIWDAERDFPIDAELALVGSFRDVLLVVMDSLAETDFPLQIVLQESARIVRVTRHMQAREL